MLPLLVLPWKPERDELKLMKRVMVWRSSTSRTILRDMTFHGICDELLSNVEDTTSGSELHRIVWRLSLGRLAVPSHSVTPCGSWRTPSAKGTPGPRTMLRLLRASTPLGT